MNYSSFFYRFFKPFAKKNLLKLKKRENVEIQLTTIMKKVIKQHFHSLSAFIKQDVQSIAVLGVLNLVILESQRIPETASLNNCEQ